MSITVGEPDWDGFAAVETTDLTEEEVMAADSTIPWYRRGAWVLVFVLGAMLAVFGAFVLFTPVDANDFEAETGVEWSVHAAEQPDVASYLEREARLLGAVTVGFGLVTAALASSLLRAGNRTSWSIAWILAATLALTAVVFFASGASALGSFYVGAAALAAVGIGLSPRSSPSGAGT